jgi:glycosyltransferase involved in cell wall biosynthesis
LGEGGQHQHRISRLRSVRTPLVSVVMPTLSEADNLPHVIPKLPDWIHELIVVDGYSDDNTVAIARSLRPDVRVVYQTEPGKGGAIVCGLAACRGDIAVLLDADGSTDPEEIGRFVAAIGAGADFVKGSRFLPGGSSEDITELRKTGNFALTRLVNLLFRTRYTDLCYGYNAIRLDCVDRLSIDVNGFEIETLMNIRAARAGLRTVEVPSSEGRRLHGIPKLRTFRDGWRVLKTILREWQSHLAGSPSSDVAPSEEVTARGRAENQMTEALLEIAAPEADESASPDFDELDDALPRQASAGLS